MLMEFVEFEAMEMADWVGMVRGDPTPFGARTAGVEVREMDRFVGARDDDGHLIAVAGAAVAQVTVAGHDPFDVVGVGWLLVKKDARAHGLGSELMARIRRISNQMGPDRAMLFCDTHLLEMYTHRGYTELTDEVWVDQPAGPIIMPVHAMWRPIRPTDWPPGTIRVHGLPF
jgi:predicted GNAT family N-acyltransferase